VNNVILRSRVRAHGVLHATVPLKLEDANKTARVTVKPLASPVNVSKR
jgi:hypothetical protein